EQTILQAGALDGLQEILGDDHVGIDIDHRQRCGDAAERRELFHGSLAKAGINGLSRAPSSAPDGGQRRGGQRRASRLASSWFTALVLPGIRKAAPTPPAP